MAGREWTEGESAAWRCFVEMHHHLERHLIWHLRREFGISGADYEILVNMSETPAGVMDVADLARATLWEKSRLSHQLRRMSERGLLRRDTTDRRRHTVVLTDAGWKVIRAASPANAERVRELFVDVLGPDRLESMHQLCDAVMVAIDEHLDQACADP